MYIEFSTNNISIAKKHLEKSNYCKRAKEQILEWVEKGWVRVCDPFMYGPGKIAFHNIQAFKDMFPEAKSNYEACSKAIDMLIEMEEENG